MAREDLEAGFTTVRDLGNSGVNGDVALREAIQAGWVVGPRIVASTRALSAAGGQFAGLAPEAQKLIEQEYVAISGVEEARRAVRQAFYDGADCIKVIVDTGPRMLSPEEMNVIVEEAHRVKKKVAAHVASDQAARIAARAGVDSIEHAYNVPDDVLRIMAEKHIFLVPTDFPAVESYATPPVPPEMAAGIQRFIDANHDRLRRAIKLGVPIATGSDTYFQTPGKTRGQASLAMLRSHVAAGMTPAQVLRAATADAAELLGMADRIGSIEAGKFADLIACTRQPARRHRCPRARELRDEGGRRRASSVNRPAEVESARDIEGSRPVLGAFREESGKDDGAEEGAELSGRVHRPRDEARVRPGDIETRPPRRAEQEAVGRPRHRDQ